jgi:hypothetical protein
MCKQLLSLRLSPEMLADLKAIAARESARRGEFVSWAKVMRDSAARTIRKAKKREAANGGGRPLASADV